MPAAWSATGTKSWTLRRRSSCEVQGVRLGSRSADEPEMPPPRLMMASRAPLGRSELEGRGARPSFLIDAAWGCATPDQEIGCRQEDGEEGRHQELVGEDRHSPARRARRRRCSRRGGLRRRRTRARCAAGHGRSHRRGCGGRRGARRAEVNRPSTLFSDEMLATILDSVIVIVGHYSHRSEDRHQRYQRRTTTGVVVSRPWQGRAHE